MMGIQDALRGAIKTEAGANEVGASWVKDHLDQGLRLVDVREPHELSGPLGFADGAENVPLLQFLGEAGAWDRDTPLVLICRSGRRSAMAAGAAKEAGFTSVASVEGGMLAWNSEVLGRRDVHEAEKEANVSNLADAVYRVNGLPEVSAGWVQSNVGRFKLVDVREPMELRGPMGAIVQAENIPLASFMRVASSWDRSQPIVVVCASGGRSGRAAMALASAGFTSVASMEGGMYGWRSAGLPVA